MGKLVHGIYGPIVGKVGNIIGSSWRGIPYIKSRGIRTKPPTEGEKLNRFIFTKTQEWLYPLTNFLRVGFKGYTVKSQGVNAAKSYLYKHALIKNGYDTVIDPSLMKVSYGSLPLPDNIQVELKDDAKLLFTWNPAIKAGESRNDQIMLLAYDIENAEAVMSTSGQFRHTGSDVVDLSASPLSTFAVYAAFVSEDRESQSESIYLGSFTLQRIENKPVKPEFNQESPKKEILSESEADTKVENTRIDTEQTKTHLTKTKSTEPPNTNSKTEKTYTATQRTPVHEAVTILGRAPTKWRNTSLA